MAIFHITDRIEKEKIEKLLGYSRKGDMRGR
jgi:hypothetical protein